MADNFFKIKKGLNLGELSSAPSNAAQGDMYTNSTTKKVMVYLDGAWHEVVSNLGSHTLTNKTLTAGSTVIKDGSANKSINFDVANNSVGYIYTLRTNFGGVGAYTLDFPSLTTADTLVSRNSTDTLTGKTIVATSNTITTQPSGNLVATELNAALSELQSDIDTRATSSALTTHTGASSGVHGVTGSVVGTTDSQTLTNKTISGASNTLSNIPNSATTATSANTASAIVARDASGNFSAGTITAANITVSGDLTVSGTTTTIDTANLNVKDKNITVNNGGNDAASEGAGITVSRTGTSGSLIYKDASATKFAAGALGSEVDLVGISSTQTLTNKTISGASNTLSNIPNSATTAASANTASAIVARDASGNFSAGTITATLSGNATNVTGTVAIANGGTGQTTAAAAFNALAPSTAKGGIIVGSGANTYANLPLSSTDNQVLVVDSSQTNGVKWTTLQQGNKNYFTYNNAESNLITGWSVARSTVDSTTKMPNQASASWTSGTLSSNVYTLGNTTATTTSSGALSGSYSYNLAVNASGNTQGDMFVSDAITLDLEAQASVQTFSFYYKVASGTINASGTSANTLAVAIYDATNNAWIDPAGRYNIVQTTGVGKCSGTFQVPSTCTSVRVAIYFATAVAASNAISVLLDDFVLGPQAVQYGAPVTDWQVYTPTITGISTSTNTAKWRRVGDTMEVLGTIGTSGAASGDIRVSVPSQFTIDTAKLQRVSYAAGLGVAKAYDSSAFTHYTGHVGQYTTSNTTVGFTGPSTAGNWGNSIPFGAAWASNDEIEYGFTVPITGWSSSVNMSSDTDTRVVAASASNSSQNLVYPATSINLTWPTITADTHGTMSSTGYTIPVSGYYDIKVFGSINNMGATYVGTSIYLDGVSVGSTTGGIGQNSGIYITPMAYALVYCKAGQKVTAQYSGTITSGTATVASSFYIERLTGPSVIAASETVACSYQVDGTGQTLKTAATIKFQSKMFDTHGAYSPSTGQFTAPVSGKYRITYQVFAIGNDTYPGFQLALRKQGNLLVRQSPLGIIQNGGTLAGNQAVSLGNITVSLNAGETVDVYISSAAPAGSSAAVYTNGADSYLSIERIGN